MGIGRLALVILGGAAIAGAALGYVMVMPGTSYRATPPALTADQTAMAQRMRGHVQAIASREHNTANIHALDQAAVYLETALSEMGYRVHNQPYEAGGRRVRNLEVSVGSSAPGKAPERIFIVGAHYDSARGAPGANDNGSGTAALLEIARILKDYAPAAGTEIKLVFYTNEEPPYFHREGMGSRVHARDLRKRGQNVEAAFSIETIGYYSDEEGSQKYPIGALRLLYPSAGDFVAVIGTLESASLVRSTSAAMRKHLTMPLEGLASPAFVPGVTWSDHSSYVEYGYKAVMITDTAIMRYPHYHTQQDTPDKLDYGKMARIVGAVVPMVIGLAQTP